MNQSIHQQIEALTRVLRLPALRQDFIPLAKQAAKQNLTHEQYLLQLLDLEQNGRTQRRIQQKTRRAAFPYKGYLQNLSIEELPPDAQNKLPLLERLDFIKDGQNVILAGNPGTGKTHIAIGLGIKACLQDLNVLFTTVPRLITQIRESRSQRMLRQLENRFEKYDLVICDEFGYVSFDKQAAELLFSHLSIRTGRKATIITTNLAFDRWIEIFGDQVLTAAMVDRLTHKAILVNMNGQSFRVKESQKLKLQ